MDSPKVFRIIQRMSHANTAVFRATRGVLGSKFRVGAAFPWGVPVALLTTTGRKSGEKRTVPLLVLRDGERAIFVGSQGGLPKHPAWYLNLQDDPNVVVQLRFQGAKPMKARTADPAERATYWPRLTTMYPDFDNYQAWTDREIPVVICEPA
ncbi:MAG TPA: nitroreductase family deazaflavin-dependent oxidoreductase [Mycobacteriales bacterium]|nr:nitroreductase family deazaflavin-dependent oxidoreductase [Mycobacteriales bacterium]